MAAYEWSSDDEDSPYVVKSSQRSVSPSDMAPRLAYQMRESKYEFAVYVLSKPRLWWGENDTRGIRDSGWEPLKSRHSSATVTFSRIATHTLCIIVEPDFTRFLVPFRSDRYRRSSYRAHGFFFSRNAVSGQVDLEYRTKPFEGEEETVTFKNCTYVGLRAEPCSSGKKREESVMYVTTEFCDKAIPTGTAD